MRLWAQQARQRENADYKQTGGGDRAVKALPLYRLPAVHDTRTVFTRILWRPMRCNLLPCALLFFVWVAAPLHGDILYRLPLKADPSLDFDSTVTDIFARALDSALSADFEVYQAPDDSAYPPDSSVCSSFLFPAEGDSVLFEFTIYLADGQGLISGDFRIPFGKIEFTYIHLLIQEALSENSFGRLRLARLRMVGCGGCRILVNGELSGAMPFETFLPPGTYDIEARGNRILSDKRHLRLNAGDDTLLVTDLPALSRRFRRRLYTGGTLCGLAAIAAHVAQEYLYRRYRDPDITRGDFDTRYAHYQTAIVVRNVMGACAAGALGAAFLITIDIPRL